MRALQVTAPGRVEFVEVARPEVSEGHVLVRPLRVSLCGSDIYWLHHLPRDRYPLPPGTTGHEMVGVVEAISDPHGPVQVGDQVLALAPDHRAMAERYLTRTEHALPLPDGVPIEHLLQAQQLGTVIYACKFIPINLIGKTVVVIGQGSAGLWFDWMLRRLGAQTVIAMDLQPHRLMLPKLYGATHAINNSAVDPIEAVQAITRGAMADLVVEAAGEADSYRLSTELVRSHGDVLCFGVPHEQRIEIDLNTIFFKCLGIKHVVGAQTDPNQAATRQAIDLIASGEIDVAPVLTHRFALEQVRDAYELQRTREEGAIKIIVDMPE